MKRYDTRDAKPPARKADLVAAVKGHLDGERLTML